MRDALIRLRVHAKVVEFERDTQKEKAGGYALVIDGPCLRAAVAGLFCRCGRSLLPLYQVSSDAMRWSSMARACAPLWQRSAKWTF